MARRKRALGHVHGEAHGARVAGGHVGDGPRQSTVLVGLDALARAARNERGSRRHLVRDHHGGRILLGVLVGDGERQVLAHPHGAGRLVGRRVLNLGGLARHVVGRRARVGRRVGQGDGRRVPEHDHAVRAHQLRGVRAHLGAHGHAAARVGGDGVVLGAERPRHRHAARLLVLYLRDAARHAGRLGGLHGVGVQASRQLVGDGHDARRGGRVARSGVVHPVDGIGQRVAHAHQPAVRVLDGDLVGTCAGRGRDRLGRGVGVGEGKAALTVAVGDVRRQRAVRVVLHVDGDLLHGVRRDGRHALGQRRLVLVHLEVDGVGVALLVVGRHAGLIQQVERQRAGLDRLLEVGRTRGQAIPYGEGHAREGDLGHAVCVGLQVGALLVQLDRLLDAVFVGVDEGEVELELARLHGAAGERLAGLDGGGAALQLAARLELVGEGQRRARLTGGAVLVHRGDGIAGRVGAVRALGVLRDGRGHVHAAGLGGNRRHGDDVVAVVIRVTRTAPGNLVHLVRVDLAVVLLGGEDRVQAGRRPHVVGEGERGVRPQRGQCVGGLLGPPGGVHRLDGKPEHALLELLAGELLDDVHAGVGAHRAVRVEEDGEVHASLDRVHEAVAGVFFDGVLCLELALAAVFHRDGVDVGGFAVVPVLVVRGHLLEHHELVGARLHERHRAKRHGEAVGVAGPFLDFLAARCGPLDPLVLGVVRGRRGALVVVRLIRALARAVRERDLLHPRRDGAVCQSRVRLRARRGQLERERVRCARHAGDLLDDGGRPRDGLGVVGVRKRQLRSMFPARILVADDCVMLVLHQRDRGQVALAVVLYLNGHGVGRLVVDHAVLGERAVLVLGRALGHHFLYVKRKSLAVIILVKRKILEYLLRKSTVVRRVDVNRQRIHTAEKLLGRFSLGNRPLGVDSRYAERKRGARHAALALQLLGDGHAARRRVIERRRVRVGERHARLLRCVNRLVARQLAVHGLAVGGELLDAFRREDVFPVGGVVKGGPLHGRVNVRAPEHGRHRIELGCVSGVFGHIVERLDLHKHVSGLRVVRGAVLDALLRALGHVFLDAEEERLAQAALRDGSRQRLTPVGGLQMLLGAGERLAALHRAGQAAEARAVIGERRDVERELVLARLAPLEGLGDVDAGVTAACRIGVRERGARGVLDCAVARARRLAVVGAVAHVCLVHAVVVGVRDLDGDGPHVRVVRHARVRVACVLGDGEGVGALLAERDARAGHLLKPGLAGVLDLLVVTNRVILLAGLKAFDAGIGGQSRCPLFGRVPLQPRDGAVFDSRQSSGVGHRCKNKGVALMGVKAVPVASLEVFVRLEVNVGRRGVVGVGERGENRLSVVLVAQCLNRLAVLVHPVVLGAYRDARILRGARHHKVVRGVVVGDGLALACILGQLVHVRAAQLVRAQVVLGRVGYGLKRDGGAVVRRSTAVGHLLARGGTLPVGVLQDCARHGNVRWGDVKPAQAVGRGEGPCIGLVVGTLGHVLAAHGGEREGEHVLPQHVVALVHLCGDRLEGLLRVVVHVGEGGHVVGDGRLVAVLGNRCAVPVHFKTVGDALHHEAPGRHRRRGSIRAHALLHLVDDLHGHMVLGAGVHDARDGAQRLGDVVCVGARLAVGDVVKEDGPGVGRIACHDGLRRGTHLLLDVRGVLVRRHGAVRHGGVVGAARAVLARKPLQTQCEHVLVCPRAIRLVARKRLACPELVVAAELRRGRLVAVREDETAEMAGGDLPVGGVAPLDDARHGVVVVSAGIRRPVGICALRQVEAPRHVGVGVVLRHHACGSVRPRVLGVPVLCAVRARVGRVRSVCACDAVRVRGVRPLSRARARGDVVRARGAVLGHHRCRGVRQLLQLDSREARVPVELRHRALRAFGQAVHAQRLVLPQRHDVAVLHREVAHELLGRGRGTVLALRRDGLIYRCAKGLVGRKPRALRIAQRQLEEELRVGGRLLRGVVVGLVHILDLLRHLQARDALVLDAHAHRGREQLVDLKVAQVAALGGRPVRRLVLEERHAVPTGVKLHDGQLAGRPVPHHVLQHAPVVAQRAVLHVHGVGTVGLNLVPRHRAVTGQRAGLLVALDVGQRVVDGVVGAKLAQRGGQRAGTGERPHAVVGLSGVGIHAVALDDDLHPRVVQAVAVGRLDLVQVVRALRQILMLVALHREAHGPGKVVQAVLAGRGAGVDGAGAVLDAGHLAVPVNLHVFCPVQRKLGAVHRVARLVHLLRPQAVPDVGDAHACGELAVKAVAVNEKGVVLGGTVQAIRRGVIETHRVTGVLFIVARLHIGVVEDVARHGGDFRGELMRGSVLCEHVDT